MTGQFDFASSPDLRLTQNIVMDGFARVRVAVPELVTGMSVEDLLWRPDPDANHIAWLVWHLSRVMDDHLAALAAEQQVWVSDGWAERFALPYDIADLGYGQSSEQVGAFVLNDPSLLTGYHDAAYDLTAGVVRAMDAEQFDRVVDRRWDPPVTAAVRVVSVLNDVTQHLGQAAYVKGLLQRRR